MAWEEKESFIQNPQDLFTIKIQRVFRKQTEGGIK